MNEPQSPRQEPESVPVLVQLHIALTVIGIPASGVAGGLLVAESGLGAGIILLVLSFLLPLLACLIARFNCILFALLATASMNAVIVIVALWRRAPDMAHWREHLTYLLLVALPSLTVALLIGIFGAWCRKGAR